MNCDHRFPWYSIDPPNHCIKCGKQLVKIENIDVNKYKNICW